ncbi:MAG TPA: DUF1926 domain-containing protein [Rhodocyclaceae bacterium]|nr:DUF1926 domain-containing protein [Rhodocyclaceae bacterium]
MTIHLLFGVHAHQPVGNFPAVIDDAHVRCYGMFLRVLDRYPDFHFSVHFSGWLLDVLCTRFPEDMALLVKMTARGQVEWFGSGDCEPVLAAIPQRDQLSQIETLSARLENLVGQRPRGAWLTERVWEASVVSSLVEAGIRYVAVDDYHFLCAGMPADALDSFYTTEENGHTLDLFPISEALRYRLPFSPADEAVAYLESLARQGQKAAIYFDDIEKFGIWPETYAWVYEQGWLARFIEGVLASPLIRTATYADYHAHAGTTTRGIVYLPTTSYIEMNEWTLPPQAARDYANLIETEKTAGHYERHKPFLRGGIWRNFLSRYPESNWMHKRMLGLSQRLAELPDQTRAPSMQEHLHRAQANDAYWHGLFGGLYLPHLRRAIWHNLIALEGALDAIVPRAPFERRDIDHDGKEELLQSSAQLQAISRHDGDACIIELSSYPLAHNFADTLRRYVEGYHAKIDFNPIATAASGNRNSDGEGSAHSGSSNGPVSAHDRVAFRNAILPKDIEPDRRPRGLFVDSHIDAAGKVHPLDAYHLVAASPKGVIFSSHCDSGQIEKQYCLEKNRLTVHYRGTQIEKSRIEIQLNLAMPSCDGFSGCYRLHDGNIPCGFGEKLLLDHLGEISLEDAELGSRVALHFSPPLCLHAEPYYTVSQSEAGFEKIMQGVCLNLAFDNLASETLTITLTVVPSSEEKPS